MSGPIIVPTTVGPTVLGALHQRGLVATGVAVGLYVAMAVAFIAGGLLLRRAERASRRGAR